jgi:hypothetical protein
MMMAAIPGEDERVPSAEGSTLQEDTAPDAVQDGIVNGLGAAGEGRGEPAEALKRAAREGSPSRWERIEECSMYGCVDWYLYPEERPLHHSL